MLSLLLGCLGVHLGFVVVVAAAVGTVGDSVYVFSFSCSSFEALLTLLPVDHHKAPSLRGGERRSRVACIATAPDGRVNAVGRNVTFATVSPTAAFHAALSAFARTLAASSSAAVTGVEVTNVADASVAVGRTEGEAAVAGVCTAAVESSACTWW